MNGLMLSLHYDLSLCALTVAIYPWSLELIKVSIQLWPRKPVVNFYVGLKL